MCGRYVTPDQAALEREYGLTASQAGVQLGRLLSNWNTSPTHTVPILRMMRAGEGGAREIVPMRWGLVPFWAKGVPTKFATINAMAETIAEKATYRGPWKRGQRCIFPTAGFDEWQVQEDGKTKIPHYIRPAGDEELFHIAGVWGTSTTAEGEDVVSCAIITMPANELMARIHNAKARMPLFINKGDIDTWLTGSLEQATALIQPYPSELMRAHPVSTRVNSPKNNDPTLIECV